MIQGKEDGSVRKGKWSIEEENFANTLIFLFNKGLLLDVPPNQTLRTYLSEKLNCDPMRITKKFSGVLCIGKQVFQSNIQDQTALENAKKCNFELQKLEVRSFTIELYKHAYTMSFYLFISFLAFMKPSTTAILLHPHARLNFANV